MSGIPAQHHRPSLDEQPLYASSGDRYAEVFVRPRAEMGLVEVFVLRWRDVPGADAISQPVREALTVDRGWQEVAPGSEAHRYDAIVAGRAGVTVDIDLLAGVLERARAQIDSLVVRDVLDDYHADLDRTVLGLSGDGGPPLVPAEITDRLRADLEAPSVAGKLLEGGEIIVGPEAGVVHYHHDGSTPLVPGPGGAGAVHHRREGDDGVVRYAAPPPWRHPDVVRPVGLVWSGIRVDELERVGYEVLQPGDDTPCPPLAAGEIFGVPEHGVIYVWSRADFDRLAQLSRRLHDARSGRGLPSGALFLESEHDAIALAEAGADSLEVAKALPRGSSS